MTATASGNMSVSVDGRPVWKRLDIQGLRAIAVLAVIAFHADLPLPGGFTGVDIFFVISGFVITQLILRQTSAGRFSFATFYSRRAQRLLPALALMTAVVFLLSLALQSPFGAQQETAQTGIGAMLLMANVVITRELGSYFAAAAETNPLLHTWSLSVEEQFYLVFPLLVVLALGFIRRPAAPRTTASPTWTPLVAVSVLTALSFLLGVAWTFGWQLVEVTNQPATWAFYLSPARAWEFGVGAILALAISRHGMAVTPSQAGFVTALGSAMVLIGLVAITPTTAFPGYAALLPVVGTALMILGGTHANPITAVLSTRPMVRIGDWSYSLYLWHWPVIVFALLLWPDTWVPFVAAALSFIPAIASYHLVENPIRARRMTRRSVAIAGVATSAVVIVLGLALWNFGGRLVPGITTLEEQRAIPTLAQSRGCFFEGSVPQDVLVAGGYQECWFGVSDPQGWVLLAGDSHAAHASTAVVQAASTLNLDVFTVSGGACPFQRAPVSFSDIDNCNELNDYIWSLIDSKQPPDAVVLASKGVPEGAEATLDALHDRDIPVVWLRNVPRWTPEEQGIQHLPCTGGIGNFSCAFPEKEVEINQSTTLAREQQLMLEYPSVQFVDARSIFCESGQCSPINEGRLAYVDNEHLNGYGSELITGPTTAALRAALDGQ